MFNFFKRKKEAELKKEHKEFVYTCCNCGNLINFTSVPCHHCGWAPNSLEQMARSMVLNNNTFKIFELLNIGKHISEKLNPNSIVLNLDLQAIEYLEANKETTNFIFSLCNENRSKYKTFTKDLKKCKCGAILYTSDATACVKCKDSVMWNESTRLLLCANNLLGLFVQRIDYKDTEDSDRFVEALVGTVGKLYSTLNGQEGLATAKSELDLCKIKIHLALKTVTALVDKNNGAIVDWIDKSNVRTHIIKDSELNDTVIYATYLSSEIENLIKIVSN
jgi:hypothetical protein